MRTPCVPQCALIAPTNVDHAAQARRKVDEQVVDAGFFEGDAGVFRGVGELLDAFLGAGECSFESLDGQAATAFGCLQLAAGVVELGVEVGLLRGQ